MAGAALVYALAFATALGGAVEDTREADSMFLSVHPNTSKAAKRLHISRFLCCYVAAGMRGMAAFGVADTR